MVPVCVEAFRLREMKLWRYGFVVALVLFPCSLQAQPASSFDEVGRFYVSSFAPEDYNARPQNWGIVQDERGFIYVGNSDGVLEYDGVSWRLIPISNRSIARSLAVDAQGRIYVGAIGELGELAPDSLGRMRYVSLVEHIPAEDRNFSDVWKTYALPEGVYFQSVDRLFRWQDGQMKVWRTQTRFHLSHVVRDTFYVHVWERGLYSMAQDTLRRAPGGATFAGQDIYALVPHGADAYLAITRSRGIFRCRSAGDVLRQNDGPGWGRQQRGTASGASLRGHEPGRLQPGVCRRGRSLHALSRYFQRVLVAALNASGAPGWMSRRPLQPR